MNCQNIDRANQMDKHLDVPKNKKKTNENLKKSKFKILIFKYEMLVKFGRNIINVSIFTFFSFILYF